MDAIVGALIGQQDELAALVDDRDQDGLERPSRCAGWTVADVLVHLAQTNEMAVASADGRLQEFVERSGAERAGAAGVLSTGSVDDWAAAMVEKERGPVLPTRDRWRASAAAQAAAFAGCDPRARLEWVAGDMAARSLATTRLAEAWIHTVDVAWAFEVEPAPTDRLWHVARLAWRTVPYALSQGRHQQAGPVRFDLEAPDGTAWDFGDADAPTVVRGTALDLCTVAGQRADASATGLRGEGPDAEAVLRLVRTFA